MGPTENIVETGSGSVGAAESGAVGALGTVSDGLPEVRELSGIDPALRLLVEVWGELPDTVKNQILKLADASVAVR